MKQLLTILCVLAIVSCNPKGDKPKTTQPEKHEMSFEKLSDLIGAENAFKVFDSAGKTEADPVAKGARKPKNNATVVVWLHDLTLTVTSTGAIEYSTSPNANWAGCQRFGAGMSKDGAYSVWGCQKYWYPNQTPDPTVTCSDAIPGGESNYRAFTSDHDYTIHVSNVVVVTN